MASRRQTISTIMARKTTSIKRRPLNLSSEEAEQTALFTWADCVGHSFPGIEYMFAVPNGGKRHIRTAIKLKRSGVRPGVPDVMLPVASGEYHGLFIEMKYGKNTTSDHQDRYLEYLKQAGYMTAVCYSFEAAVKVIENYYGLSGQ